MIQLQGQSSVIPQLFHCSQWEVWIPEGIRYSPRYMLVTSYSIRYSYRFMLVPRLTLVQYMSPARIMCTWRCTYHVYMTLHVSCVHDATRLMCTWRCTSHVYMTLHVSFVHDAARFICTCRYTPHVYMTLHVSCVHNAANRTRVFTLTFCSFVLTFCVLLFDTARLR